MMPIVIKKNNNPFRLSLQPSWLARAIEKVVSLNVLAKYYDARPNSKADTPSEHVDDFLDFTLGALNSRMDVLTPNALAAIPATGPVIMVSNHPLGGLEGVAMTKLLKQQRPDLKVLTNEMLSRIPEFSDIFIGVDVLSKNAAAKNVKGMREVIKHLKTGGALLIYPAGMVSAIDKNHWRVCDREWQPMVGKLAKQFQATCVPFYVHGRNSRLFYAAGLVHPRLRTALLPRELATGGRTISLVVGDPIRWRDMCELGDAERVTSYLRTACDLLSHKDDVDTTAASEYPPLHSVERTETQQQALLEVLSRLEGDRLLQYRNFDVYCSRYEQLGPMMDEIAVARERTFRAAGEGTGFDADSDRFDPHYLHLFIWDREAACIVGSYRVGRVDDIVDRFGVDGLYSRTLYHFDERFLGRMGGAIEVGRSFVSTEYQRHPRALDLLWQGLGAWMVANPDYHTLFGCVSISSEHSVRARAFLEDSLMSNYRAEQSFINDVRPVMPLQVKRRVWSPDVLRSLSSLTLINKLLGQCDPGKSVPILLRQYIALNGRFIGFSVNESFNNSLDGLIMVDLRKTPLKYLQRYLGKQGSQEFLRVWGGERDVA